MSRRDDLLAKAVNIRSASEIPASEVLAASHTPRSGQGSYSRRQALEERIAALEQFGGEDILVASVEPNPWQPRKVFDGTEIRKLADSIAEMGLIQPIVVRRVQNLDTAGCNFQLVAGERRFRAHLMLGRANIKAVVVSVPDEEMAVIALVENMDRQDLSAYEIAVAIRNAEASFPNRKELAKSLGIQRSDLYRYLSFFQLPDFLLHDLETTPSLLGRDAAEAIASNIKKHGQPAIDAVSRIWTRVKSRDIDQGKVATLLAAAIKEPNAPSADRDIKKLFIGKEQAGSITRDATSLTVKIRASALTPKTEAEIRSLIERLIQ
jgi:ParB family chromosome partitioning protein